MPTSFHLVAVLALATLPISSAGDARHLLKAPAGLECIKLGDIRAETAEADDALIVHAGGSIAYRNRLPHPCDGLRGLNNLSKLELSPSGDRLCKGDTIRVTGDDVVSSVLGRNSVGSTSCTLGTFEPINEMSLTEALRR